MQKDCHYYVTYIMARKAGFLHEDAKHIAWAAQTVDEMEHEKIRKVVLKEVKEELYAKKYNKDITLNDLKMEYEKKIDSTYNLTTFQDPEGYLGPMVTDRSADSEMEAVVRYTWVPFHFLPISYNERSNDSKCGLDINIKNGVGLTCSEIEEKIEEVTDSDSFHVAEPVAIALVLVPWISFGTAIVGGLVAGAVNQAFELLNDKNYQKKTLEDRYFICHHSTKLCLDMVGCVAEKYQKEKRRHINDNSVLAAIYRIGVTMHALADTWSHENFCGSNNMFINHTYIENGLPFSWNEKGPTALGFCADGVRPLSMAWVGHGAAGTNPDVPGNIYKVKRTYFGYEYEVNNIVRYEEAFKEMLSALKYINDIRIPECTQLDNLLDEEKMNITNSSIHQSTGVEKISGKEYSGLFTKDTEECRCDYMRKYVRDEYGVDIGDYDIYEKGEKTSVFMNAARAHRDYVMSAINYTEPKNDVDIFVKEELKNFGAIEDDLRNILRNYFVDNDPELQQRAIENQPAVEKAKEKLNDSYNWKSYSGPHTANDIPNGVNELDSYVATCCEIEKAGQRLIDEVWGSPKENNPDATKIS